MPTAKDLQEDYLVDYVLNTNSAASCMLDEIHLPTDIYERLYTNLYGAQYCFIGNSFLYPIAKYVISFYKDPVTEFELSQTSSHYYIKNPLWLYESFENSQKTVVLEIWNNSILQQGLQAGCVFGFSYEDAIYQKWLINSTTNVVGQKISALRATIGSLNNTNNSFIPPTAKETGCSHPKKYINKFGSMKFWVCPDCKKDLGDV